MHDKKKYNSKTSYSIQGLRHLSKSLPTGLKTILKKGGHNYSTIINNWSDLVGKKIANVCYPKSIKNGKDLKNGGLFLNVSHGDQILVEYSKKDILDKINAFFGYEFIKEVRLVLVREKIDINLGQNFGNNQTSKYRKKIEKMGNNQLKKNLDKLIDVFTNKKV